MMRKIDLRMNELEKYRVIKKLVKLMATRSYQLRNLTVQPG